MNINISEKDLHRLIMAEMRYAMIQDSHIIPWAAIEHVKTHIPSMPVFGIVAAGQLKSEIENEMRFKNFSEDKEQMLIGFMIWLNDFIIKWRAQ